MMDTHEQDYAEYAAIKDVCDVLERPQTDLSKFLVDLMLEMNKSCVGKYHIFIQKNGHEHYVCGCHRDAPIGEK